MKKRFRANSIEFFMNKPLLAIVGQFQNGKSTLLNCLLGGSYAVVGAGTVTTRYNTKYSFGEYLSAQRLGYATKQASSNHKEYLFCVDDALKTTDKHSILQVNVYSPFLLKMDILDSPGYGANKADDGVAEIALQQADFVIFVLQKALDKESDIPFLKKIAANKKHFTVILNCLDGRDPFSEQVQMVGQEIYAKLLTEKLNRNYVALSEKYPVYPVNLLWAQCALGCLDAAMLEKNIRKIKRILEQDVLSPASLFYASNFAPLRRIITSFVDAYFHYSPEKSLSFLPSLANEWTDLLVKTLKG